MKEPVAQPATQKQKKRAPSQRSAIKTMLRNHGCMEIKPSALNMLEDMQLHLTRKLYETASRFMHASKRTKLSSDDMDCACQRVLPATYAARAKAKYEKSHKALAKYREEHPPQRKAKKQEV